ncbi:MAG: T9SS type A sorting domain-containing protein [Saprospiraceae bacterium]
MKTSIQSQTKRIFFILFMVFLSILQTNAQTEPPTLYFDGVQPNWLYISKDTNFIQSPVDPYSSPYWGRQPQDILFDSSGIYVLEICASQSPYGGMEGSILHKLDMDSGEPIWINFNNTYVGNIFREFYTNDCIRLLDEDKLEIIGYRDIDTIDFTQPQFWGFNGSPVKRVINRSSGISEEVICSQDSFRSFINIVGPGYNKLFYLSDNEIIQISKLEKYDNDSMINDVQFYDITDQMKIDTPYYNNIEYNTKLNICCSDVILPQVAFIGQDTLAITFGKIDTLEEENSPSEFQLRYYDISDKNNFKLIYQKDLRDIIYFPQESNNEDIDFTIKDGNIFLTQECIENKSPLVTFFWMTWLNKKGEVLSKVYKIKDNNSGEYYSELKPIGVLEEEAYFTAKLNDYTYHILKCSKNSDEMEYVGKLQVLNKTAIKNIYLWKSLLLPSNKILMEFNVYKYNDLDKRTNFSYYYNFNLEDLNIFTKTKETYIQNELQITPNPSQDWIDIQCKHEGNVQIQLIDIYGRILKTENQINSDDLNMNISDLSAGMYIIRVLDSNAKITGIGKVIKY